MKLDLFLFFLLLLYFDCLINESLDWFVLPNLYVNMFVILVIYGATLMVC